MVHRCTHNAWLKKRAVRITAGLLFALALPSMSLLQAADSTFVLYPHYRAGMDSSSGIIVQRLLERPRVGLVLSGGGARGVAQIGVIKALERNHVPIDFIAATSMGAIVGGLYAAGYNPTELESLAVTTNWDEVLSLTDDTKRTDLFMDQKLADDRSFLAIRFEGFSPVLPSAVSSGQRLTDFLSDLMLQALYHPFPDFDDLRIPFRAVATDLVSGRRVVLRDGSLAEALRATASVPLLFRPVERDSMRLVDGGLVDNIPVDVARMEGCDVAIAVNSTSGLRTMDEMNAPWQTADQIMGIMMDRVNERALLSADVVLTPDIGRHPGATFRGLDTLIRRGDEATERMMPSILRLIRGKADSLRAHDDRMLLVPPVVWECDSLAIPDSILRSCLSIATANRNTTAAIRMLLDDLYSSGRFRDVNAAVTTGAAGTHVRFSGVANPLVKEVRFDGCRSLNELTLHPIVAPLKGKPINIAFLKRTLEDVMRAYRAKGFALARIDTTRFDEQTGKLSVVLDEGVIQAIDIQGGERTQDAFVLREFPLAPGDVFTIGKARKGLTNLSGTRLFEFVYLEVRPAGRRILLTIRLKERPSQLARIGLRIDDERHLQGSLDIRDENFHGTGTELGLTLSGGQRNTDITVEYKAQRLLDTYLTFGVNAYHRVHDSYMFETAPRAQPNRWKREHVGEYRDIRYGFGFSFGGLLERLGNAAAEFSWQNIRLVNLENLTSLDERYRIVLIRLSTVVDTKNSYPFPTAGVGMKLFYEFSMEDLGSEIGYNSLYIMYETYGSWGKHLTFHPKLTMGVSDRTMPLAQQFRLGGHESFYGLREDDRRGRQLLLVNAELRYFLPVNFVFDTYIRARYDLGTISAVPEEIKFSSLLHGIGVDVALATPIGPAAFGVGKCFYFSSSLPNNPLQQGPFVFYFTIGYQL
jgi:NTE family protein